VEKLLEYMSFRAHYETVGPKEEIPVHEFMERIAPEIVLELLVPRIIMHGKILILIPKFLPGFWQLIIRMVRQY
jgi:hypothetical protein